MNFPERAGHQVFIEPDGRDVDILHLNGVATSLPTDIQAEKVGSIKGLERAIIALPRGSAIECN